MEAEVPDGSYDHGEEPMLSALDGRRVLLQLQDVADSEICGSSSASGLGMPKAVC